ncbi:MAG: tetratricopeptide repeat protein [Mycobacteriales bacterium]
MNACIRPDCSGGTIVDGYCDLCGMAPAGAPVAVSVAANSGATVASGSSTSGATVASGSARGRRRGTASTRSSGRGSRRGRLGAGLVEVPLVPRRDPATAVLADPKVPEHRRFCSRCGHPVGRAADGKPGRTEGFCRTCGSAFSFSPKLAAGDLVGGQYEVLGCLAHGGLGWIYLARDRNVSDRWVALKGLLDTGDADAIAAALAERRFLAEVEHPNIVKIYNFVQHPDPRTGAVVGYIVMEYVGGESLKDRRHHAGGPLPLDQVLAYGLEMLPALGYLHSQGLLFCDFKPDNVIQTDEQLRLIDLGAVRHVDDEDSAVYGTLGYQAPEVAEEGPSVASDLYTVARTMAVLSFDFRFTGDHRDRLPDPADVPLLAEHESYHRLLLRATDPDPDRRFGSAEEMAEQVTGVLREVLAAGDGQPRPGPSTLFTPEQRVFGDDGWPDRPDPAAVATALPVPQVDTADPAAGLLATAGAADPAELIATLSGAPTRTVEVRLRIVRARIEAGDPDSLAAATADLDALAADEPGDWRVDWYRGLACLAAGLPGRARPLFDAVYGALPGESAPKLALAFSAEATGDLAAAGTGYARVWRTERSSLSAAFGLARVRSAGRDRAGAVAVLDEVPDSSSHRNAARAAAIRARYGGEDITVTDLEDASARLERLGADAETREWLAVELLAAGRRWLERGGSHASVRLLGHPFTDRDLRLGLERCYRTLARLTHQRQRRVELVDLANAVRPRTLT